MSSELKVDTISEKTSANGVTIDGVNLKDSVVKTDTISEKTSAAGVTIDGVTIKDGKVTTANSTGLTLINSSTFSGVSSKSIDSVFSSTYTNYRALISIKTVDNNVHLYSRFRDGSGDITSSNYDYKALYALNSNTNNYNNGRNGTSTNAMTIIAGVSQTVAYHGYLDILEPNIADRTGVVGMQTGTGHLLTNSASFNLTTQLTGISFYAGSGNISGEIQIYGYGK